MLTQALIHSRNAVDYHVAPTVAGNTLIGRRTTAHGSTGTLPVRAWIAELEADPEFAGDMAAARAEMAASASRVTLAVLRLRARMSQTRLATAIGTTQANISRIESGRQQPSFDTVRKIARVLGVSLDDLAEAIDGG